MDASTYYPTPSDVDPEEFEATREVTAMLSAELHGPLCEVLVAQLVEAYQPGGWPVLRAAAGEVLHRLRVARKEELRIASRPEGGTSCGIYRVRQARRRPSAPRIMVSSWSKLRASCDCSDYRDNSLGLCKHVLAVLEGAAGTPARWRSVVNSECDLAELVWWSPFRSMQGQGDWLEGLRFPVVARAGRLPNWLLLNTCVHRGRRVVARRSLQVGANRVGFIEQLEKYVRRHSQGRIDVALTPWLKLESEARLRSTNLECTRTQRRNAMANFRLKLLPYQKETVRVFMQRGRLLLADDMGLGKTIQATAIAHMLMTTQVARRVLIVAPASLKGQWSREWRRCTDLPIEVVDGSPETRHSTYERVGHGAIVVNYEQCLRDLSVMKAWSPDLVILDEGQRIKNEATQTSRAVKSLDARYRLVLTGTPIENRLNELASIMDWVDPQALAPKWRLCPQHMYDDADGQGMRELGVLRKRLEPYLLRRRRSEILEQLPERRDHYATVAMSPEQKLQHDELDPAIARLIHVASRRNLSRPEFLRLMSLLTTQRVLANAVAQQHFGEFWPRLEAQRPTPELLESLHAPKLLQLRALVSALVRDQGRKVVIFSQWRRMLTLAHWALSDILRDSGQRAAFFTGAESQKKRQKNIVEFHDEPELSVLLCSDAGGVGLNLQRAASACIHLELPWNPAVLEQRTARIHRMGQDLPVDVYHLISAASIEQRILRRVRDKQTLFDGVLDGCEDEIEFAGGSMASDLDFEGADVELEDDVSLTMDTDRTAEIAVPAEAEGTLERMASQASRPRLDDVEGLFAGVRMHTRDDGGLRLDAEPGAAKSLQAMFEGMAKLLAAAGRVHSANSPQLGHDVRG